MREILFRGKRVDNGEWETSVYPYGKIICGTITHDFVPSTVGQYIGLKDKNGKRIFEGDIVKIVGDAAECIENPIFTVQYETSGDFACGYGLFDCFEYEVIGNINGNPELLDKAGA